MTLFFIVTQNNFVLHDIIVCVTDQSFIVTFFTSLWYISISLISNTLNPEIS